MRSEGYLFYIAVTVALVWLAHVVVAPNWSQRKKITFTLAVSVVLFGALGSYRLATGKSVEDNLFQVLLCPIYTFKHCRDDEAEQQRLAAEADRKRLNAEARAAEAERQRIAAEAKAAEAEQQRIAAEAKAAAAEQERQRTPTYIARQEDNSSVSRPPLHGATFVGSAGPGRISAFTSVNQLTKQDAEAKALADCSRLAQRCKLVASFVGPGKCVYLAAGGRSDREPGRTRRTVGARVGWSESEAMFKCQREFQRCRVFHRRCNY